LGIEIEVKVSQVGGADYFLLSLVDFSALTLAIAGQYSSECYSDRRCWKENFIWAKSEAMMCLNMAVTVEE